MDVLSGVPGLHAQITFRPLLVFPGCSLVNCGDDNGCRRVLQPVLFPCRASQIRSLVPLEHRDQIVALRPISVNAGGQLVLVTRHEKNLQRIKRAGRRRRALALGPVMPWAAQSSCEVSASVSAPLLNSRTDRRRRKADSTDILLSGRGAGSLITPARLPLTRGLPPIGFSRRKIVATAPGVKRQNGFSLVNDDYSSPLMTIKIPHL